MRKILLYIFLLTVEAWGICHTVEKKQVLLDCQADLDDMVTLLFLLKQEEVDLLGITVTANGKATFHHGARNILRVLNYVGNNHISVATSNKPPLQFNGFYPQEIRDQADQLYDLSLPLTTKEPSELNSTDFIIEKLLQAKGKVSILCTGPLTNLGRALKKEPAITQKIEKVIIAAGALNAKGNILEKHNGYYNRLAEYNLFLDGKAAEIIFRSQVPIVLVPLDNLEGISLMNAEVYRLLVKEERDVSLEFIFDSLSQLNYPFFGMNKSVSFWGIIASALLMDEQVGELISLKLKMNLDYGPYYGMLSIDRNGFAMDVLLKLCYEKFFHYFEEKIK